MRGNAYQSETLEFSTEEQDSSVLQAYWEGGYDDNNNNNNNNSADDPREISVTRDRACKSVRDANQTDGGRRAALHGKFLASRQRKWLEHQARRVGGDVANTLGLSEPLRSAGLPLDPCKVNTAVKGRFPDGPILNDAELKAIRTLSASTTGRLWLSEAGLFHVERAKLYLAAGKFHDWLLLQPANMLLLATLAFQQTIGADRVTPAYSLGRHMVLRTGDLGNEEQTALEAERDGDIQTSFVQTMLCTELTDETVSGIEAGGMDEEGEVVQNRNAHAADILQRVLLVMQAGLRVYDQDQGQHVDYEGDMARALAHGGRVNIRIPALLGEQTGRELTDWIGITGHEGDSAVFERKFGTHYMDIGKNTDEARGHFVEEGSTGAAVRNVLHGTELYGVNLSAGGMGNRDCNGDVILPDGSHGHMFIGFTPPTKSKDGALQIGMETTAPHAASLVGYAHTAKSTEATANPESSFGGHKAAKVGDGVPRKTKIRLRKVQDDGMSTNARYVDLAGVGDDGDWLNCLKSMQDTFEGMVTDTSKKSALEALVGRSVAWG